MTSRRSWPSTGRLQLAFVLLLVLVAVGICVPVFALLPSLSSTQSLPPPISRDEKVSMVHTLLDAFSLADWFNSELKLMCKCFKCLNNYNSRCA